VAEFSPFHQSYFGSIAMLTVFLHGLPDASFFLIAFAVVAAIALVGAAIAIVTIGRGGGAVGKVVALVAGTVGGFALAIGVFLATSTSPMFKEVSAGPLLTAFVLLALGGGFAVAALAGRWRRPGM
jgi:hypothetical protein